MISIKIANLKTYNNNYVTEEQSVSADMAALLESIITSLGYPNRPEK